MTEHIDMEPIPVHVTGMAAEISLAPAAPPRRRRRTEYLTVVLTADEPQQVILPASGARVGALVQALDNDIVLGGDLSKVQAKNNLVASTPYPSGTLVPKANTRPWPVDDNGAVYAGATTTASSSRISITAVYED